ncbi:unnamed protein product [Rhizopus stolonifer]
MLQLWNHKIRSAKIMEQMEAITFQWEELKLTIYATNKLNAILEAKTRYEIEMMNFDPDDENAFVFRSESTEEIEARENDKDNEKEMDGELEEELLNKLNGIKLEEGIVTSSDWEDFIIKKISRKRKT